MDFFESYHFIDNHPAFYSFELSSGISTLYQMVVRCCKNGYAETNFDIVVYERDNPRYKEFCKSGKYEINETLPDFKHIYVPYEDYFGYKWEYDHVEIWLEGGCYQYADYFKSLRSTHDLRLDCGGNTYEEAIIKMATLVKKYYGDYSVNFNDENSILTDDQDQDDELIINKLWLEKMKNHPEFNNHDIYKF